MGPITHIIVHHSAVSYDKNPNQFTAIDNYHKSKGWGGIGYNFLIEKDGTVKTGRSLTVPGAHTYQQDMNYHSVGICLTGDFDAPASYEHPAELPTDAQCKSLYDLIIRMQSQFNVPDQNVVPHRHFAPKPCWGKNLPDDILSYLKTRLAPKAKEVSSWAKSSVEKAIKKKIATAWNDPQEMVMNRTAAIMLFRAGLLTEDPDKSLIPGVTKEQLAVLLDRLGKL